MWKGQFLPLFKDSVKNVIKLWETFTAHMLTGGYVAQKVHKDFLNRNLAKAIAARNKYLK